MATSNHRFTLGAAARRERRRRHTQHTRPGETPSPDPLRGATRRRREPVPAFASFRSFVEILMFPLSLFIGYIFAYHLPAFLPTAQHVLLPTGQHVLLPTPRIFAYPPLRASCSFAISAFALSLKVRPVTAYLLVL